MGSSNKKLLSGDNSWEILSEHSKSLLNSIQRMIDEPERLEPDAAEASEVAVRIVILNALHKAGLMRSHPHPDKVVQWRDTFFEVFEEFAENNWSTDDAKIFRKEFKSPFNKLIRNCKSAHGL